MMCFQTRIYKLQLLFQRAQTTWKSDFLRPNFEILTTDLQPFLHFFVLFRPRQPRKMREIYVDETLPSSIGLIINKPWNDKIPESEAKGGWLMEGLWPGSPPWRWIGHQLLAQPCDGCCSTSLGTPEICGWWPGGITCWRPWGVSNFMLKFVW